MRKFGLSRHAATLGNCTAQKRLKRAELVLPSVGRSLAAKMLGVAAMAIQNALVRISLTGAPSTAVMTTKVTVFAMDIGEILLARTRVVSPRRASAPETP